MESFIENTGGEQPIEESSLPIEQGTETSQLNLLHTQPVEHLVSLDTKLDIAEGLPPSPITAITEPTKVETPSFSIGGIPGFTKFTPQPSTYTGLSNTIKTKEAVKAGYDFKNYTPEEYLYKKQSLGDIWGRTLANIVPNAGIDIANALTLGALDLDKHKNVFGEVQSDPNGGSFDFSKASWWAGGIESIVTSAISIMALTSGSARLVKPLFEKTKNVANLFRTVNNSSAASKLAARLREIGYINKSTALVAGLTGGYVEGFQMANSATLGRYNSLVDAGYSAKEAEDLTRQAFQTELWANTTIMGLNNALQISNLTKVFGTIKEPTSAKIGAVIKNMIQEGFEESVLNSLATTTAEYYAGLTPAQLDAHVKGDDIDLTASGFVSEYKDKLSQLATWEEGFFGMLGGLIELSNIKQPVTPKPIALNPISPTPVSPTPVEKQVDLTEVMANKAAAVKLKQLEISRWNTFMDQRIDPHNGLKFTTDSSGELTTSIEESPLSTNSAIVTSEQIKALLDVEEVSLYTGKSYEEYTAANAEYGVKLLIPEADFTYITTELKTNSVLGVTQSMAKLRSITAMRAELSLLLTKQALSSIGDPSFVQALTDFVGGSVSNDNMGVWLTKVEGLAVSPVKTELQRILNTVAFYEAPAIGLNHLNKVADESVLSVALDLSDVSKPSVRATTDESLPDLSRNLTTSKYLVVSDNNTKKVMLGDQSVIEYTEEVGDPTIISVRPEIEGFYNEGLLDKGLLSRLVPFRNKFNKDGDLAKTLNEMYNAMPRREQNSTDALAMLNRMITPTKEESPVTTPSSVSPLPATVTPPSKINKVPSNAVLNKMSLDELIAVAKEMAKQEGNVNIDERVRELTPLLTLVHELVNSVDAVTHSELLTKLKTAHDGSTDKSTLSFLIDVLSSDMYAGNEYMFKISDNNSTQYNQTGSTNVAHININFFSLLTGINPRTGKSSYSADQSMSKSTLLSVLSHELLHVVNIKFRGNSKIRDTNIINYAEAVRKIIMHYLPTSPFTKQVNDKKGKLTPVYRMFYAKCNNMKDAVAILAEAMSYCTNIGIISNFADISIEDALKNGVITKEEAELILAYSDRDLLSSYKSTSFFVAFLEFMKQLLSLSNKSVNDFLFSLGTVQSELRRLERNAISLNDVDHPSNLTIFDESNAVTPFDELILNTIRTDLPSGQDTFNAVTEDDMKILEGFEVSETKSNLKRHKWKAVALESDKNTGEETQVSYKITDISGGEVTCATVKRSFKLRLDSLIKVNLILSDSTIVTIKNDLLLVEYPELDLSYIVDAVQEIVTLTNVSSIVDSFGPDLAIAIVRNFILKTELADVLNRDDLDKCIAEAIGASSKPVSKDDVIPTNFLTHVNVGETGNDFVNGTAIKTFASDTRTYDFLRGDLNDEFVLLDTPNYIQHSDNATYLGIGTPNNSRVTLSYTKLSTPISGPNHITIGTLPTPSYASSRKAPKEDITLLQQLSSNRRELLSRLAEKEVNRIWITNITPGYINVTDVEDTLADSLSKVEHTKLFVHDGCPESIAFTEAKTVKAKGCTIVQYSPPPSMPHWRNLTGALMIALPYASVEENNVKKYLYRVYPVDTITIPHFNGIDNGSFSDCYIDVSAKIAKQFKSVNATDGINDQWDLPCQYLKQLMQSQFLFKEFVMKKDTVYYTGRTALDINILAEVVGTLSSASKTLSYFYDSTQSPNVMHNLFIVVKPMNTAGDKYGYLYINKQTGEVVTSIIDKKDNKPVDNHTRLSNELFLSDLIDIINEFSNILPVKFNTLSPALNNAWKENGYYLNELTQIVKSVATPFNKIEMNIQTWSVNDQVSYGFPVNYRGREHVLTLEQVVNFAVNNHPISEFIAEPIELNMLDDSTSQEDWQLTDPVDEAPTSNVVTYDKGLSLRPAIEEISETDTTTITDESDIDDMLTESLFPAIVDEDTSLSLEEEPVFNMELTHEQGVVDLYEEVLQNSKLLQDLGVLDDEVVSLVKNLLFKRFQYKLTMLDSSSQVAVQISLNYAIKTTHELLVKLYNEDSHLLQKLRDRIYNSVASNVFNLITATGNTNSDMLSAILEQDITGLVHKAGQTANSTLVEAYCKTNNISREAYLKEVFRMAEELNITTPKLDKAFCYIIQQVFKTSKTGFNVYSFLKLDKLAIPVLFSRVHTIDKADLPSITKLSKQYLVLFTKAQAKAVKLEELHTTSFDQTNVEDQTDVQLYIFDNIYTFIGNVKGFDQNDPGVYVHATDLVSRFIVLAQRATTPLNVLTILKKQAKIKGRVRLTEAQVDALMKLNDVEFSIYMLNNVESESYRYDKKSPKNSVVYLKNEWDVVLDRLYDRKQVVTDSELNKEKIFQPRIDKDVVMKRDPDNPIKANLNHQRLNALFTIIQYKYTIQDMQIDTNSTVRTQFNMPTPSFIGLRTLLKNSLLQIDALFTTREQTEGNPIVDRESIAKLKEGFTVSIAGVSERVTISSERITATNVEEFLNKLFNTNITLTDPVVTLSALRAFIYSTKLNSNKQDVFVDIINDMANGVNSLTKQVSTNRSLGTGQSDITKLYHAINASVQFINSFVYTAEGNTKATLSNGNTLSLTGTKLLDKEYLKRNVITMPNFNNMHFANIINDYLKEPSAEHPTYGNEAEFISKLRYIYIESLTTQTIVQDDTQTPEDLTKAQIEALNQFSALLEVLGTTPSSVVKQLKDKRYGSRKKDNDLSSDNDIGEADRDISNDVESTMLPVEALNNNPVEFSPNELSIDYTNPLDQGIDDPFELTNSSRREYRPKENNTITLAKATTSKMTMLVIKALMPKMNGTATWFYPVFADKQRSDAETVPVIDQVLDLSAMKSFVDPSSVDYKNRSVLDKAFVWNNVLFSEIEWVRLNYEAHLKGIKNPGLNYFTSNSVFYMNPWLNGKLDKLFTKEKNGTLALQESFLVDVVSDFIKFTEHQVSLIEKQMIKSGAIVNNQFVDKPKADANIQDWDKLTESTTAVITHTLLADQSITSNMFNTSLIRVGTTANVTAEQLHGITVKDLNKIFKNYEKRLPALSSPKTNSREGTLNYLVIDDVKADDQSSENVEEFIEANKDNEAISTFVRGSSSSVESNSGSNKKGSVINEITNGQTYITYASFIKDLYYRGSLSEEIAILLIKKHFNLPLLDDEKVKVDEASNQLQLVVLKPLMAGVEITQIDGYPVQRLYYNKSSDFVLHPAFSKLTNIREALEESEKIAASRDIYAFLENSNLNLATFPSALKCGRPTNIATLTLVNGSYVLDRKEGDVVTMTAAFRGIQITTSAVEEVSDVTNTSAFTGVLMEGSDDMVITGGHPLSEFREAEASIFDQIIDIQVKQLSDRMDDNIYIKTKILDQIEILSNGSKEALLPHINNQLFYDIIIRKYGFQVIQTAVRVVANNTALVKKVYGFTAKLSSGLSTLFDPSVGSTEADLLDNMNCVILTPHAEMIDGEYTGNLKPIKFLTTGVEKANVSQTLVSNEFVVIDEKGKESRLNLEEKDDLGNYKYIEFVAIKKAGLSSDGSPKGMMRLKEGVLSDKALLTIGSRVPTQGRAFIATSEIAGILPNNIRHSCALDNRLLETIGHDFDYDSWYVRLHVLFPGEDNTFGLKSDTNKTGSLLNELLDLHITVDTSNNPKIVLDKNRAATNPDTDEIGDAMKEPSEQLAYFTYHRQAELRESNSVFGEGIGYFAFLYNAWGLLTRAKDGFTNALDPLHMLPGQSITDKAPLYLYGELVDSVNHKFRDSVTPSTLLAEWLNNFVDFVKSTTLTSLNLRNAAFSGVAGLSMFAPFKVTKAMLTNPIMQSWFMKSTSYKRNTDASSKTDTSLIDFIKDKMNTNKAVIDLLFTLPENLETINLLKEITQLTDFVKNIHHLYNVRQISTEKGAPPTNVLIDLLHRPGSMINVDSERLQHMYIDIINLSIDQLEEVHSTSFTEAQKQAITVIQEFVIGNTWLLATEQASVIMVIGRKVRFPANKLSNNSYDLITTLEHANQFKNKPSTFFSRSIHSKSSVLMTPRTLVSNKYKYYNFTSLEQAAVIFNTLWNKISSDMLATYTFLEGVRRRSNTTLSVTELFSVLTNIKYKALSLTDTIPKFIRSNTVDSFNLCAETNHVFYKAFVQFKRTISNEMLLNNISEQTKMVDGERAWIPLISTSINMTNIAAISKYMNDLVENPVTLFEETGYTTKDFIFDWIALEIKTETFMGNTSIYKFLSIDSVNALGVNNILALTKVSLFRDGVFDEQTYVNLSTKLNIKQVPSVMKEADVTDGNYTVTPPPYVNTFKNGNTTRFILNEFKATTNGTYLAKYGLLSNSTRPVYNQNQTSLFPQLISTFHAHFKTLATSNQLNGSSATNNYKKNQSIIRKLQSKSGFIVNVNLTKNQLEELSLRDVFGLYTSIEPASWLEAPAEKEYYIALLEHLRSKRITVSDRDMTMEEYLNEYKLYNIKNVRHLLYFASLDKTVWNEVLSFSMIDYTELITSISKKFAFYYNFTTNGETISLDYDVRLKGDNKESTLVRLHDFMKGISTANRYNLDVYSTPSKQVMSLTMTDSWFDQVKDIIDLFKKVSPEKVYNTKQFKTITANFNIYTEESLDLLFEVYDEKVAVRTLRIEQEAILANKDLSKNKQDDVFHSVTEQDVDALEFSADLTSSIKTQLLDKQRTINKAFVEIESNSVKSIASISTQLVNAKAEVVSTKKAIAERTDPPSAETLNLLKQQQETVERLQEQLSALSKMMASFTIAREAMTDTTTVNELLGGAFRLVFGLAKELEQASFRRGLPLAALTSSISSLQNLIDELDVLFESELSNFIDKDSELHKYKAPGSGNTIKEYVAQLKNKAKTLVVGLEAQSALLLSDKHSNEFINGDVGTIGLFASTFMTIKSTSDKFAQGFVHVIESMETEMAVAADSAKIKYNNTIKRLKKKDISFKLLFSQADRGFVLNKMLTELYYESIGEINGITGEDRLSVLVSKNPAFLQINPFHLNLDMVHFLADYGLISNVEFSDLKANADTNAEAAEETLSHFMTAQEINKFKLSLKTNTDLIISQILITFEQYSGNDPFTSRPINTLYNQVAINPNSLLQTPLYLRENMVNQNGMTSAQFRQLQKHIILDSLLKGSFYYAIAVDKVMEPDPLVKPMTREYMVDSLSKNKFVSLTYPNPNASVNKAYFNNELQAALEDKDMRDLYGMLYDISSYFSQNNMHDYYAPSLIPFTVATTVGLKETIKKLFSANSAKVKIEELFSEITATNRQYGQFKANDYATLYSFNANQAYESIKNTLLGDRLSKLDEERKATNMPVLVYQMKYLAITTEVDDIIFKEFGDTELNNMGALIGVYYTILYKNILADSLIAYKHVANSVNQSDLNREQSKVVDKIKSDVDAKLSKLQLFNEVNRTNNTTHKYETLDKLKQIKRKLLERRDILLKSTSRLDGSGIQLVTILTDHINQIDELLKDTKTFNITKAFQLIITANSFLVLGFNLRSWINNFVGGMASNFIQSNDTPNYNAKDYSFAVRQALAACLGVFKLNPINKPYWDKITRLQDRYKLLSTVSNELMLTNDVFMDAAFFGSRNGEQIIQSPAIYAVLSKATIKIGDKKMSLWELTNEEGLFAESIVPQALVIETKDAYTRLMQRAAPIIRDIIKKSQGDYFNNLPITARQHIGWRLVSTLRLYITSTMYDAFKGDTEVDTMDGDTYVDSGYMRSIARLMGPRFDHTKGASRLGMIAKGASILAANLLVTTVTLGHVDIGLDKYLTIDGKVSVGDKLATVKMFKFLRVTLLISLLTLFIRTMGDDEDDDNTILVRNIIYSMSDQLLTYADPSRIIDLIKQPSAVISLADKIIKAGDLTMKLLDGNDVLSNGTTDFDKLSTHIEKQIPIWNTAKYRIPNWISVDYENAERYGNAGSRSNR